MQYFSRIFRNVQTHLTKSVLLSNSSNALHKISSSGAVRGLNARGSPVTSVGTGLSKWGAVGPAFSTRSITTMGHAEEPIPASVTDVAPRIKFKRLDKTAKHIMQILDKEAVQGVREQREIPDIRPGYIVQLKVEVPENKRRVSLLKGIVIARRNAGLNSTFRIRRLVAGVGVESVFPLYSPNIKEMKVLDKKKVRRAKLYYLRDKMNALKRHLVAQLKGNARIVWSILQTIKETSFDWRSQGIVDEFCCTTTSFNALFCNITRKKTNETAFNLTMG
ncbi:Ribosomal protein L19 [Macleaya cordata]|uniref:Ribosomal protein L19 n=1 Tax=Macleaya cordata TaxID=56857 RepID=A0A200RCZ8_MACCD|nr:Ribosomal protein L19 [Macleaya cordata]